MSRFIQDGVLQVHHVASIADPSAPTLTEVQAGTDITGFLRSLETPNEGSIVDAPAADSTFNETVRGTHGGQAITGEFYRDKGSTDGSPGTDTAWDTLPRGTEGYLVIARFGGSGADGALAVGDIVDVWPVDVATRENLPYERNQPTRFRLQSGVPDQPNEDVALA